MKKTKKKQKNDLTKKLVPVRVNTCSSCVGGQRNRLNLLLVIAFCAFATRVLFIVGLFTHLSFWTTFTRYRRVGCRKLSNGTHRTSFQPRYLSYESFRNVTCGTCHMFGGYSFVVVSFIGIKPTGRAVETRGTFRIFRILTPFAWGAFGQSSCCCNCTSHARFARKRQTIFI